MFQLYCILLAVLAFIYGDLCASINQLQNFFCSQGVDSGFRVPSALVAAAVDSLEPEILDQRNSLTAPSSAFAKPGLVLLAALALAVCWKSGMFGPKGHELDECLESERMNASDSEDDMETDLSDSEDDMEIDLSDSEDGMETDISESLNDLETDLSDSEDDSDTDMSESENELEADASEVSRLDDSLDMEDLEDTEEKQERDMLEVSRLEDSLDMEDLEVPSLEESPPDMEEPEIPDQEESDVEKQSLAEALERSQVCGNKMEHLWKEAQEEIVRLQNQLVDQDKLLEKSAQEEAGLKREIENVYLEKEHGLTEKRRLEGHLELAIDRGERIANLNKELKEKTESLESQLEAKDVLLKKRDEEEREKQNLFQQALVEKEGELESAIKKKTELGLKLKQIETSNQKLASEKEYFEWLIEGYKDAVSQKKKEVDHIQEVLGRKATEAEKDRETLEVIKSENARLRELTTDLQDRNCEFEKNLVDETQKNLILTDKVQLLELLLGQKESQLVSATEILTAERANTEILAAELKKMKNWVSGLGGENAKYKEQLEEKEVEVTKVKKELDNGKITIQTLAEEAQVMKNWVAELGGENARLQEEVDENQLQINSLKKSLMREKQRNRVLQDALHHEKEMENLLKEEKRRGNEMETSLRTLEVEFHNRDLQRENFLNTERKLRCEIQDLVEKLAITLNHGKELDSLLEEAKDKARKLAKDFEEEVQKREAQKLDFLGKEQKLKGKMLTLESRLKNAENLLMKEERENLHLQQRLQEKDKEVETLRKDEEDHQEQMKEMEDKLQNLSKERNSLIEAVEKQSRECHLLIAEKEREKSEIRLYYQERLDQKDSEMKKLQEECDKLKENWRIQEENMIREHQRLMERQRRQEEALRDQDKYMLMTLLHGTAQRNFHLQHIALQHGIEQEQQDGGQAEDLWMRREKQYRKYCDAQSDRSNYGKQWEVLTQTLTDLIHEEERIPQTTNGDSNENCEIFDENSDDKMCHQSNNKIEPQRADTHEENVGGPPTPEGVHSGSSYVALGAGSAPQSSSHSVAHLCLPFCLSQDEQEQRKAMESNLQNLSWEKVKEKESGEQINKAEATGSMELEIDVSRTKSETPVQKRGKKWLILMPCHLQQEGWVTRDTPHPEKKAFRRESQIDLTTMKQSAHLQQPEDHMISPTLSKSPLPPGGHPRRCS
ncbi:trichohyalin-like [Macrobrachium nipponense]|uniref:trichohyalin-like n=1 Tax=Macrobrachium nipponense TaxID=159736 RepID=UPI0030C7CA11